MGEKKRRGSAAALVSDPFTRAQELHASGQLSQAQELYRQLLAADDSRASVWLAAGRLASDTGRRAAAVDCFAKAVALAADDAEARIQYASVLQDRQDFEAARIQWRAACTLCPGAAMCWESLGIVEQALGECPNAAQAYQRAIALEPTPCRHAQLATLISPIPASRAIIAFERSRMHAVLDSLLTNPVPPESLYPFVARCWTNFYLAYHGINDRDLQVQTCAAYRKICPSLNYTAAHCERPGDRSGRIRVGMISQYFRSHSIGRTSRGLFAQVSRERFEVTAIFIEPLVEDAVSAAIRADAEHSLVLSRNLSEAREQIAALQLDILFYQDIGMEPFSYFLSYARLAPVQCVSFGHPDTTGVSTVDYFVSNELFEPEGAATHYSERLFLLRNLGTLAYYYRPQLRLPLKSRAAFGLASDCPLYLCPQNLFKVHPDMDDLLAGILRRDPHGMVVLVEGRVRHWTGLLRRRWQQSMPDVCSRIVFVPRMSEHDYLNLIAIVDVMLDTVHFNGMNTSLEAFAVGTPVVTMPGAFQRGRHTQAMYRRMGIDGAIAHDGQGYIDEALRLGTDPEYRARASACILERNSVLFEDSEVIREFERFFSTVAG